MLVCCVDQTYAFLSTSFPECSRSPQWITALSAGTQFSLSHVLTLCLHRSGFTSHGINCADPQRNFFLLLLLMTQIFFSGSNQTRDESELNIRFSASNDVYYVMNSVENSTGVLEKNDTEELSTFALTSCEIPAGAALSVTTYFGRTVGCHYLQLHSHQPKAASQWEPT